MINTKEIYDSICNGFSNCLDKTKKFIKYLYEEISTFVADLFILLFHFLYFIFSWIFVIVVSVALIFAWLILKLFNKKPGPLSNMIKINIKKKGET